jgi:hypothetical protein
MALLTTTRKLSGMKCMPATPDILQNDRIKVQTRKSRWLINRFGTCNEN